jgi:putative membrane protein
MMWGWGNSWWNWLAMFLMMAVFWGGVVTLIVFAMRGGRQPDERDHRDRPDARSILEERFARGEISEDELEQKRRVLEHAGR